MNAASDSSTTIPIQPWMLEPAPRRQTGGPGDADLLARIAGSDREAFRAFHERHARRVTAYARQLCRDRHLAEDVTQEVFTSVWTRAGSFRPERTAGDALGWLYALTRNKLIDHWRRGPKGMEAGEVDEQRLSDDPDGRELRVVLRQALARVPPDQREAIELAYFGGLTYQETAGELELPLGTLKSRIRLGLKALRNVLGEGWRRGTVN